MRARAEADITTSTPRARCGAIVRFGVGMTLVCGGTGRCGLDETEDERLDLQLTAKAMLQAHFDLTLETDPVHIRCRIAGVEGQLLPAVLQHPTHLTLRPERKLTRIACGDYSSKIHSGRCHHHTIGADRRQEGDHSIISELLTLLENVGIDNAISRGIEKFDSRLDRTTFAKTVGHELNDIAVVNNQCVASGHSH